MVADVNIGILYVFALASVGVYGLVLAGWSSNNKFALIGGFRSSAQVISYELSMGLAAIAALLAAGSLRLTRVVEYQASGTFLGFLPTLELLHAAARVHHLHRRGVRRDEPRAVRPPRGRGRARRGLPHGILGVPLRRVLHGRIPEPRRRLDDDGTLYFGGWSLPVPPPAGFAGGLLSIVVFFAKTIFFIFLFVWVRWTLPRFRFDQLMNIGWKVLLPLSLLNLLWTGALVLLKVI